MDFSSHQASSTRSVGMNLARRFNAGEKVILCSRRVATIEFISSFSRRYATRIPVDLFPALKGRAKFIPTLRVENS
jgi:short-subunit dehydrogenase involved in D-alanine esterification of teichoic acids